MTNLSPLKNIVYAHEHMCLDLSTPDRTRVLRDFEATSSELIELKSKGVSAIIDVTADGMGRDAEFIHKLREKTGMKIPLATGSYKEPYLPKSFYSMDEKQLLSKMIAEVSEGIEIPSGQKIKASVIGEIGSSKNIITTIEKKIFNVTSILQKETSLPLVTHTTLSTMAMEQIAIFKEFGLNLANIVISHMDLAEDTSYIVKVLDSGINIGFDTIGKTNYQSDETRLNYLEFLVKRGYENQIVLSLDLTSNKHLKKYGGLGYDHLLSDFLPKLTKLIPLSSIEKMLVKNPHRIFKTALDYE